MKQLSEQSQKLYSIMVKRGFTPEFAYVVCGELNTDFTASKMIGYLNLVDSPTMEEVADEMLSIITLRDNIVQKKVIQQAQASYNEYLNSDLRGDDD